MADIILKSKFPYKVELEQGITVIDSVDKGMTVTDQNKPALINTETKKTYTFAELIKISGETASGLYHHGLRQGDIAALMVTNCEEICIFILATLKIGAKVVLMNAMATADDLVKYVNICGAKFILTSSKIANAANKDAMESLETIITVDSNPNFVDFHSLQQYTDEVPPRQKVDPMTETTLILFSSGTTGYPKAVEITHDNFSYELELLSMVLSCECQLIYQPMAHIYGTGVFLLAMKQGITFCVMPKFHPEEYIKNIVQYKCDLMMLVPPVATILSKGDFETRHDLSRVKSVFSAGAPLNNVIKNEIIRKLGGDIYFYEGYGMTEMSGLVTCGPPRKDMHLYKPQREGSVGIILPGVEVKVVDVETGKTCGPFQNGEICSRSRLSCKGYLNNPKATEGLIIDGWVHSGDIGYYDDNECFYIVDRVKELIKYNALQVSPSELEEYIHEHPAIADVAVVGVPDETSNELPTAWIVLKPGKTVEPKEIADFLAAKVASYKKLRGGVKIVDTIPKAPSGKILRRLIKEKEMAERQNNNK